MKKIFNKLCEIRNSNAEKYKKLKILLILFYPLLIVLIAEMNQIQSFRELAAYYSGNINILLFALFYEILLFGALFFVSRSAVISMSVNSFVLFLLSCVGYYKFESCGVRFTITDLAMAVNLSDVASFATINIKPILVVNLAILIFYIFAVYILNIKINLRRIKSFAAGTGVALLLTVFITVPALAAGVSDIFELTEESASISFKGSEGAKTNFTASFIESMTNQFTSAVKKPDGYSEDSVLNAILPPDDLSEEIINPDVIFILSEAYVDFRRLAEADSIPVDTYKNFDLFSSEGFGGTCVSSTFGGYTVRAEFEILFGLPVYSLNTPEIPHMKINISDGKQLPSMANFYKSHGYNTTYIHPFSRTFYNRDNIYPYYGFDNLYFADNFTVPLNYKGRYIDDSTAFDMIIETLGSSDTPQYITLTTMQNHVPYIDERDTSSGSKEFAIYMSGIKATDEALGTLRERLLAYEKPTVVVFLGDHYPAFTAENSIYDTLDINASTNAELYEQSYFIWSNYGLDLSEMENYPVLSAFYLPNVTVELTGLSKSGIINTVLNRMKDVPVYSPHYTEKTARDEILDLLTYDLLLGKNHAKNKINK